MYKPAKIFYTSLKKADHPHNQFVDLKQFIHDKVENRLHALPESIFQSLKKLGEEHNGIFTQWIKMNSSNPNRTAG